MTHLSIEMIFNLFGLPHLKSSLSPIFIRVSCESYLFFSFLTWHKIIFSVPHAHKYSEAYHGAKVPRC